MDQRLTVLLPREQADWLKREADRQDRPLAYIVRRCVEVARREAMQERAAA